MNQIWTDNLKQVNCSWHAPTQGQLWAVWKHRLRGREARAILATRIPCLVIHGRDDIIAAPRHGQRLAARLHCPFLLLDGAHFVFRESAALVNGLLRSLLQEETPLSQALQRATGQTPAAALPPTAKLEYRLRNYHAMGAGDHVDG